MTYRDLLVGRGPEAPVMHGVERVRGPQRISPLPESALSSRQPSFWTHQFSLFLSLFRRPGEISLLWWHLKPSELIVVPKQKDDTRTFWKAPAEMSFPHAACCKNKVYNHWRSKCLSLWWVSRGTVNLTIQIARIGKWNQITNREHSRQRRETQRTCMASLRKKDQ